MWATWVRGTASRLNYDDLEVSLIGVKREIAKEQRQYYRAPEEEIEFRAKKKENVKKLRAIRDDLKFLIKRHERQTITVKAYS